MINMSKQMVRQLTILILLTLALAALPGGAGAQSPLSASVDRTDLTTDDIVTLSVVVNSASGITAQPELPPLDDFAVVGTNLSTQVNMVNGAMSASVAYDYQLQPTRAGDLVIDAILATIDGKTYATNPITLHVTQGTGRPAGGQRTAPVLPPGELGRSDYYLEATVDKTAPYVGEQVLYTVRFYTAADAPLMGSVFGGQPTYGAPSFTGFWSQNDTQQQNYRVTAGGRIYNVTELRTLLFPTAAGSVIIEPAQIVLPDSFFQRGGAVQAKPVTVDVTPLPAGAPAGFSGAVGRYTIQSELDLAATDTDNPVTLHVTVAGTGNVSSAGDPVLPVWDGWRAFPGKAEVTTAIQDNQLYGQRVYAHVLAPTVTGSLAIPAIDYVYFDPADAAYHTASTASLAVQVAQGKLAAGPQPAPAVANDTAPDQALVLALQQISGPLQQDVAPLTAQPWYWLLWIMPLTVLTGSFAWQRRQVYLQRNAAAIRSSKAGKQARRALQKARTLAEPAAKGAAVQTILVDYLSARLHRPVAGLTHPATAALLAARGVEIALSQRTTECLAAAEQLRFSPATVERSAADLLVDTVETTIAALDVALG